MKKKRDRRFYWKINDEIFKPIKDFIISKMDTQLKCLYFKMINDKIYKTLSNNNFIYKLRIFR